jgi:peptidoglycan/LPS O-acetylase OafA/YrhL
MRRLSVIDALRGLAAFAVLLFHERSALTPAADPASAHPILAPMQRVLSFGYLGVGVFFAVSGWCIARRARQAWKNGESETRFWTERAIRIFPVYWMALLLTLGLRAAATGFNHKAMVDVMPQGVWGWVGDFLLIQPYLGKTAYLLVSWSLVCELAYYVLSGLALGARRRGISNRWILIAGFLLVVVAGLAPAESRYKTLAYWPDFFAGAVAWHVSRRTGAGKWSFGLGGLGFILLAERSGWNEPFHLTAIATALLLLLVATHDLPRNRFVAALQALGAISYPLYLVHLPLISAWNNLARRFIPAGSPVGLAVWLAGISLALALAWLVHRFCETPTERWRRTLFTRKPSQTMPMLEARTADAP